MPKELPGFYYDPEKNRYFPYKGPIPGSKPKPKIQSNSKQQQLFVSVSVCTKQQQSKLIRTRELLGNNLTFQSQYLNTHASTPLVWKYQGTKMMANMALHHLLADVITPHGLMPTHLLFTSGANGLLSFLEIGAQQQIGPRQFSYKPDCVWPHNLNHIDRYKRLVGQLGTSHTTMTRMPSDVTCIKTSNKYSSPTDDTMSKHFLMTTLGSDSDPGSFYLVDMGKPIDFDATIPFHELAYFKQTLWTADCDPQGGLAAIEYLPVPFLEYGTQKKNQQGSCVAESRNWSIIMGASLDVFSVQLNQSGKVVLWGLRNGGIVSVDTRQKQIKRKTNCSPTISMPSSVCCLASLNHCDQYFLASSMDGSIKLYDHRLIHRNGRAVQSYEGNANSHTRLELGVDPSDKFIMSGGEDCYLRMWNIKSGELLFRDRFMNSPPSVLCWPRNKGVVASKKDGQDNRYDWEENHIRGAWLGSAEGNYYMDWL